MSAGTIGADEPEASSTASDSRWCTVEYVRVCQQHLRSHNVSGAGVDVIPPPSSSSSSYYRSCADDSRHPSQTEPMCCKPRARFAAMRLNLRFDRTNEQSFSAAAVLQFSPRSVSASHVKQRNSWVFVTRLNARIRCPPQAAPPFHCTLPLKRDKIVTLRQQMNYGSMRQNINARTRKQTLENSNATLC